MLMELANVISYSKGDLAEVIIKNFKMGRLPHFYPGEPNITTRVLIRGRPKSREGWGWGVGRKLR